MTRKIEVVTTTIDTDETRTRDVLYSGDLTPRRLARAVTIALEHTAWVRRTFGPMATRPKHDVKLLVDGNPVDAHMLDGFVHAHGETWSKVAADLARAS